MFFGYYKTAEFKDEQRRGTNDCTLKRNITTENKYLLRCFSYENVVRQGAHAHRDREPRAKLTQYVHNN